MKTKKSISHPSDCWTAPSAESFQVCYFVLLSNCRPQPPAVMDVTPIWTDAPSLQRDFFSPKTPFMTSWKPKGELANIFCSHVLWTQVVHVRVCHNEPSDFNILTWKKILQKNYHWRSYHWIENNIMMT